MLDFTLIWWLAGLDYPIVEFGWGLRSYMAV